MFFEGVTCLKFLDLFWNISSPEPETSSRKLPGHHFGTFLSLGRKQAPGRSRETILKHFRPQGGNTRMLPTSWLRRFFHCSWWATLKLSQVRVRADVLFLASFGFRWSFFVSLGHLWSLLDPFGFFVEGASGGKHQKRPGSCRNQ